MAAIQFNTSKYTPDIIVTNKDGQVFLVVEAKANQIQPQPAISQLKSYLSSLEADIRFAMLANLETISIFQVTQKNYFDEKICLKTSEILNYYDAEFAYKRIFSFYLITLLEAWLRDLAYHWKSEKPPGSEELKKIGLLEEIEGGDTYSQND